MIIIRKLGEFMKRAHSDADASALPGTDTTSADASVSVAIASGISADGSGSGSSSLVGSVPESWKWILDIFDEAHLPKLGLPVQWESSTSGQHTRIAFNPETGERFPIEPSRTLKKIKPGPVGFIHATDKYYSMPGTEAPASVRFALFQDPRMQGALVEGSRGESLVPCLAHGDYVQVESLEADHVHAKSDIIARQMSLVNKLNTEPDFAEFVMKLDGINKFFVHIGGTYYGTLYFYELYFNDIDNIWLICGACNKHKSDKDPIAWFENQWPYGKEFFDYLSENVSDRGLLKKLETGEGLAQAAIAWFWSKQALYVSTSKIILNDIETPIKILGRKIGHIAGSGKLVRAERLQASLDGRMEMLLAVMRAPIGMARNSDDESFHSSSDEELRMPTRAPRIVYERAMRKIASELPQALIDRLGSEIQDLLREKEAEEDAHSIYTSPS